MNSEDSTERKTRIKSVAVAMITFAAVIATVTFADSLAHPAAELSVIAVALVIGVAGISYSRVILHG